jgi:SAM-dependent methyltransferase
MGYPECDAAMIAATMAEERDWQGTGDVAERNLSFLRVSAPQAVDFINVLHRYVSHGERTPRALELGCGNGWVSWLLAEAGFDTWMCDFEANSLVTGLNLEHPNIGDGKRFVTDARYAPVASGSMDLVVFKEFVHHVSDYRHLFREANRVLSDGGIMALMEPVRSVWRTIYEMRHPDPHEGHNITWPDAYLRAIRSAGLRIVHEAPYYMQNANRRRVAAWMKNRAVTSIDDSHPSGNLLAKLQLRLFGGAQFVVVARKVDDLPVVERPPMAAIDPDTLIVGDDALAGYAEFPSVLRGAAAGLERLQVARAG